VVCLDEHAAWVLRGALADAGEVELEGARKTSEISSDSTWASAWQARALTMEEINPLERLRAWAFFSIDAPDEDLVEAAGLLLQVSALHTQGAQKQPEQRAAQPWMRTLE
jgi:hypothetical protein